MGNSSVPLYINIYNTYVEQYSKERPRNGSPKKRTYAFFFFFPNRGNYGKGNREWGMGNGEWENEDNDTYIYYWTHTFAPGIATAKRNG